MAQFGSTSDEAAIALTELAQAQTDAAEYREAEASWREALDILLVNDGEPSPDVGNVLTSLAGVLQAQGRYEEAYEAAARAVRGLDACLADAGDDVPPDIVALVRTMHRNALAERADAARLLGRYQEAEGTALELLDLCRAHLPPNHPQIATALNALGVSRKYLGRFDESEACYQEALTVLGDEGDALLRASLHHNLAGIYHALHRYEDGVPHGRASVRLRESVLGSDHPDVAADLHGLAALVSELGHAGEAQELYERALDIVERTLGPEHPEVAFNLNNLASLAKRRGDFATAERHYRRALELKTAALGADHPGVALSQHNLSVLLRDQGRREEALELSERAVSIATAALGEEHPHTQAFRRNLQRLKT